MKDKLGSRTAKTTALIGDDYYTLKLGFDQLVELQDITERGPLFIVNHLRNFEGGNWCVSWIYHTIRLGLVGSEEFTPREAVKFCDRHVRSGFALDYLDAAASAIEAALAGRLDDVAPVDASGEGEVEDPKKKTEPEADQTSSV